MVGTPQVACGHLQPTQGLPWWFRGQETALQYQGLRPDRSLLAQWVKYLPAVQETKVRSLGWEDSLENEMATPSSILAWRTSRTEEPGGRQSMGLEELDTTY